MLLLFVLDFLSTHIFFFVVVVVVIPPFLPISIYSGRRTGIRFIHTYLVKRFFFLKKSMFIFFFGFVVCHVSISIPSFLFFSSWMTPHFDYPIVFYHVFFFCTLIFFYWVLLNVRIIFPPTSSSSPFKKKKTCYLSRLMSTIQLKCRYQTWKKKCIIVEVLTNALC